ncbi:MAG: FG-GAP repeat protein, partial [Candidatus Rokubacteria bacterium]|nr:FG-GAP repeat protein [Candidatus Rokubacteria bacterium]
ADIAVYRPSTGEWFILRSSSTSLQLQQWGALGDTPVPADYDGDGKADVAIYRPATGEWFLLRSSSSPQVVQWGAAGNMLLPLRGWP